MFSMLFFKGGAARPVRPDDFQRMLRGGAAVKARRPHLAPWRQ